MSKIPFACPNGIDTEADFQCHFATMAFPTGAFSRTSSHYISRCFGRGGILLASVMMLFLLTGCIDYDEEMWLNPDLSGHVAMTISVQEELVRGHTGFEKDMSEDGIRREVERIPGVKLDSFESFRDAGRVIAKLRITFDSIEKLTRSETGVAESSPISLLGAITVREEGGKVFLERTMQALPQARAKSMGEDMLLKGLGSLLLSNHYLTYTLHVPGDLITANTERIEGDGHTVQWKFTLAQAMREPPEMTVEWKKPFAWIWIVVGSVCAGAVIVASGMYLMGKRRSLS
jgi:hypothetical protein